MDIINKTHRRKDVDTRWLSVVEAESDCEVLSG